jgi:hypothetical protein
MRRKILLLSFALVILATASFASVRHWRFREAYGNGHAKLVYKEISLGRKLPGYVPGSVTRSRDDRAIAYVVKRGDKMAVVWNGVEQKPYDKAGYWTADDVAEMERLRKRFGSSVIVQVPPLRYTALVLSDGGKHIAYLASSKEGQWVVHDRDEGRMYEEIGPFYDSMYGEADKRCDLVLSEDGEHVAYTARRGSEWFVVMDSVESGPYEKVDRESLQMSDNGEHLAYVAHAAGKAFAVFDGLNHEVFDEIWMEVMSPDGQRLAYWANRGGNGFVVVDGVVHGPYDVYRRGEEGGSPMVFSPDSKRLAYVAFRNSKALMVCDGIEGKVYDEIEHEYAFSQDGRHFAYVGAVGTKSMVRRTNYTEVVKGDQKDILVVDGIETKQYDEIYAVEYCADSTLAYLARRGDEQFVVTDGRESPKYRAVKLPSYVLRPDGTPVIFSDMGYDQDSPPTAYLDRLLAKLPWLEMEGFGLHLFPVVNGIRGKAHGWVCIVFSADRRHTLYVDTITESRHDTMLPPPSRKCIFVVDGKEAPQYPVPSKDYIADYSKMVSLLLFFVEEDASFKIVEIRVVPD